MLNLPKLFITLFLFISVSFIACKEEKRYSPDGYISLKLIEPNVSLPKSLEVIQQADPSRICLFRMGDTSSGNDFLFTIARMTTGDSIDMRKAFDENVRPILPPMTELVSADIYEKDGKMYYRKLTESFDPGHKVRNTMFYVMENELSDVVYELKATCNAERADVVLAQMEKIAGSVEFMNHEIYICDTLILGKEHEGVISEMSSN
jgi:hypothetical protein